MMSKCFFCSSAFDPSKHLIFETEHWQVLLHSDHTYFGRSTVLLKRHCASLSELSELEWLDLKAVIERLEAALRTLFNATQCNWSSMMNQAYQVDPPVPHVHFHV